MLKAMEAKKIADQHKGSLDKILKLIKERAEDGFYYLECNKLSLQQSIKLFALGYNVHVDRNKISWDY